MPIKDEFKRREYQNTRNAKKRAVAQIDAALAGNEDSQEAIALA
jgi:hypothetical protein